MTKYYPSQGEAKLNDSNELIVELSSDDVTATVVDLSGDITTVTSSAAYLLGVYVNTTLSAHAVGINDGLVSKKLILPASLAAGTSIDFRSASFATSIVVDPNDSSTGEIVVFWKTA
jgi:hypothetical protein